MKTKFKETIEKCDSLEQRLNDLLKEKQSVERKWVPLPGLAPCSHYSSLRRHPKWEKNQTLLLFLGILKLFKLCP